MQKLIFLIPVLFLSSLGVQAQTPTWADDAAPILYAHCTSCHHNGGIGGFPLMSYAEASVPYIDIPGSISSKEMPPWKPDPNYRHFKDENVLTSQEIQTLTDWVNGGWQQGNPANAPQMPVYNPGSQLSQVDKSLQCPTYTVAGTTDEYRSFVMSAGNSSPVYINQIEYVPGNTAIVHHIVLYYDATSAPIVLDQASPGPGFASNGVGPLTNSGVWLGAWAPGQRVVNLPANMGFKIPANANFVVEVHYAPGSQGISDSTQINLKYTNTTIGIRELFTVPFLEYDQTMTDGPLFIPANTVKTFHHQRGVSGNISLISLFPHMHKVGTSYKSFAKKGATTIPLIDIPEWDFHWQGYYTLQQVLKIDAGTTIYGTATYDNTTNNLDNPSNPPQDVSSGEHTTQEMMILFLTYAYYQTGDENIILDSTMVTAIPDAKFAENLSLYPNPAHNVVRFSFENPHTTNYQVSLWNATGTLVEERKVIIESASPSISGAINLQAYPSGVYFLQIVAGDKMAVKKIVKD
jgi:Secretion system C-terminal sorting domain